MDESTDIVRLPVNSEQHRFNSWEVKYTKSHILSSQCTQNGTCKPGTTGNDELCLFCMYTHKLDLPHLPDMVFPCNKLQLTHDSGCKIEFNALDSLSRVSNGKMVVKIASSASWKESRSETGHTESVIKPFDWTFSTDYQGTLLGDWKIEPTNVKIDLNKLMQKEKILFYNDLTLFEDELHDNGTALLSVKIRVMPTCFFILLRFFLRVDNVLIKINDTRLYHEFENNYIIREYTAREAKIDELKVPSTLLLDPNEICRHLPLIKESNHKLLIPDCEMKPSVEE
ncbi:conserved hypothetical protein [Pediculus humanus corporis]|uniref:TIP41-like protein n=1 Tax=Pediculus humanus subsp. corporis TaxID=121224 RepID=E0VH67_PEDHC|nr:uncharacterized protein Phum_PHUM202260 [Pediculus humanus corporis]EEB12723.1 conserved hypothetical protein [Pediculus humanus corporis]